MATIDFYFDFSSPYGYFASTRIEEIGSRHGQEIRWWPYLMGAVMKVSNRRPPITYPLIGDYLRHDVIRSAALLHLPFHVPSVFPVTSVAACRAYYWIADTDPTLAKDLARALYHGYFVADQDISEVSTVVQIAREQGVDIESLNTSITSSKVKQRLRDVNDEAIAKGVFGSPFILVGDEPFWGHDRLEQVDHWLQTGGW